MTQKSPSSLSTKRIIISVLLFAAIPASVLLFEPCINQWAITTMAAFNIFGTLLCIYDWNLFAIHYNRAKHSLGDTTIYTLIGILLIGTLFYINKTFLHGTIVIADPNSLTAFGYARFGMWMGFSFMQSLSLNIVYKCITDRFDACKNRLQLILLTSFIFAFIYMILFIPFSLKAWIRTYFYNVLLTSIMSYLYNQSGSFISGALAMGIVYLLAMVLI